MFFLSYFSKQGYKAVFMNMQITECAWKAHNGQQPD